MSLLVLSDGKLVFPLVRRPFGVRKKPSMRRGHCMRFSNARELADFNVNPWIFLKEEHAH